MKLIIGLALALLLSAASAHADEKAREVKFPFFPSLLSTADGRAVTSADFEDPGICMGCHPVIYKQWNGSMHSNAFVDPVFQALWRIGVKETNGAVEKLCAGCHTAIGTLAGEVKLGPDGVFQASDSNTSIPPKGAATPAYSFELPADAKGPLSVTATLRYRSFDQELANFLLGAAALKVPVIDMVPTNGEIPLQ